MAATIEQIIGKLTKTVGELTVARDVANANCEATEAEVRELALEVSRLADAYNGLAAERELLVARLEKLDPPTKTVRATRRKGAEVKHG